MIPVSCARDVAKKHDQQIVVVVGYEQSVGRTNIVTYGVTSDQKQAAADAGDRVAHALNLSGPLDVHEDYRRAGEKAEAFDEMLELLESIVNGECEVGVFIQQAKKAIAKSRGN